MITGRLIIRHNRKSGHTQYPAQPFHEATHRVLDFMTAIEVIRFFHQLQITEVFIHSFVDTTATPPHVTCLENYCYINRPIRRC